MKATSMCFNWLVIPFLIVLNGTTFAQDAQPNASPEEIEATHDALRALKQEAEQAFNDLGQSGEMDDLERLLNLVDEDIVLAAMNGSFAIGKSGIIEYFNRTMTGPDRTVQSIHQTFEVADLTTLYGGDTGVAYGTSVGTYELTGGMTIVANTIWTATMVNQDGTWLLASFQFRQQWRFSQHRPVSHPAAAIKRLGSKPRQSSDPGMPADGKESPIANR